MSDELRSVPTRGVRSPRRRILLVDDDTAHRRMAATMIESMGHEVLAVIGAEQAFDAVRNGRFDLILMDVQMPGIDGLEATERMVSEGLETPIVGFTAGVDSSRCLAAGMAGWLQKPVRLTTLSQAIDRFSVRTDRS